MWNEKHCPICQQPMERYGLNREYLDGLRCPIIVDGYRHYDIHFSFGKAYWEQTVIFPYLIESYYDFSDIYCFSEDGLLHRKPVLEIPYLQINWNDLNATREKLRTYILFA